MKNDYLMQLLASGGLMSWLETWMVTVFNGCGSPPKRVPTYGGIGKSKKNSFF
jgi:hypothetical protein